MMMNKIIDFLSKGPVLGIILVATVLLILPAKDKPGYLYAAVLAVLFALGLRLIDYLFDLQKETYDNMVKLAMIIYIMICCIFN